MPIPSLGFIWALVAFIAVLLVLAITVVATVFLHSRKIRESEDKFRLLFDRAFDAIVLVNKECRIVDANESSHNLLGYPRRELLTLSFESIIPRDKWPTLHSELEKTHKSGIDCLGETELITKAGGVIYAEIGVTALKIGGQQHLIASFRDIGTRKRAEEELREKNSALKEVLAHIEEEKMKFKQEVADTIDQILMPALNRLVNGNGSVSKPHLNALKESMRELATSTGGARYIYGKLTPREVEICNLVKSGANSKDIAEALNISPLTVNKHRERIRKKLVIWKKDINLSTYLNEP